MEPAYVDISSVMKENSVYQDDFADVKEGLISIGKLSEIPGLDAVPTRNYRNSP